MLTVKMIWVVIVLGYFWVLFKDMNMLEVANEIQGGIVRRRNKRFLERKVQQKVGNAEMSLEERMKEILDKVEIDQEKLEGVMRGCSTKNARGEDWVLVNPATIKLIAESQPLGLKAGTVVRIDRPEE